ncbi:hypothetical protein F4808DRAFT_463354 [Astrocystis sublimbata]|nr:hypothetical protein F4808DRAFT_463354 [Astrocystis sublimbata]
MKASFFTFLTIGGFVASSIANPIAVSDSVVKRQDDDDSYAELGATLETLLAQIQEQTALINATLEGVPDEAADADTTAAAESIAPQLEAITALLTAADGAVTAPTKRSAHKASYGKPDLFKTVSIILYELLYTVKVILKKLGLGKVVKWLTPLVLSLKGLLFKLDIVVQDLLIVVGKLANELLKAVGVALIGLTR